MLPAHSGQGHDALSPCPSPFQLPLDRGTKATRGARSAAAALAVAGVMELSHSLALDDRRRKLPNLEAIVDLAELIRFGLVPELEASARSFDTAIARAASAALGALSVSASAAGRLREIGGAA